MKKRLDVKTSTGIAVSTMLFALAASFASSGLIYQAPPRIARGLAGELFCAAPLKGVCIPKKKAESCSSEGCAEGAQPGPISYDVYLGIDFVKLGEDPLDQYLDAPFFLSNLEPNPDAQRLADENDSTPERYDFSLKSAFKKLHSALKKTHPDIEPKSDTDSPDFSHFRKWVEKDRLVKPLLVTNINADSPAKGILEPGDILLLINGKPIDSVAILEDTIIETFSRSRDSWNVHFDLIRGNSSLTSRNIFSGKVKPSEEQIAKAQANGQRYQVLPLSPRVELPKTVSISAPKESRGRIQNLTNGKKAHTQLDVLSSEVVVDQSFGEKSGYFYARVGLKLKDDQGKPIRYVFELKSEKSGWLKDLFVYSNAAKKEELIKSHDTLAIYLREATEYYRIEFPSAELLNTDGIKNPFLADKFAQVPSLMIDATKVRLIQRIFPYTGVALDEFLRQQVLQNSIKGPDSNF